MMHEARDIDFAAEVGVPNVSATDILGGLIVRIV